MNSSIGMYLLFLFKNIVLYSLNFYENNKIKIHDKKKIIVQSSILYLFNYLLAIKEFVSTISLMTYKVH